MWLQISLFVSGIGKDRSPIVSTTNPELTQMITNKTGVQLSVFYISQSSEIFGMMSGIPGHPTMLLSEPLYKTFDYDELQFVLLHEMGHLVLQHTLKELALGAVLAILGILLLKRVKNFKQALILSAILGSIFGVIALQYGKLNEYAADQFAIDRMNNPTGAIDAAYKFKDAYNQPEKDSLKFILFYRRIPYYERIEIAKREIERRRLVNFQANR